MGGGGGAEDSDPNHAEPLSEKKNGSDGHYLSAGPSFLQWGAV